MISRPCTYENFRFQAYVKQFAITCNVCRRKVYKIHGHVCSRRTFGWISWSAEAKKHRRESHFKVLCDLMTQADKFNNLLVYEWQSGNSHGMHNRKTNDDAESSLVAHRNEQNIAEITDADRRNGFKRFLEMTTISEANDSTSRDQELNFWIPTIANE